ncbi:hypothetical protein Prudu_1448S000500 [Prunus dulcis]|uniref:Uncharacterized protein n=1 Tax=Prunus dulcis TaxID=3755 RepID=A0A5H2XU63_PRUDU|nr:hypothetical protein Prudu_1448S000500 [Prunus dulcis]
MNFIPLSLFSPSLSLSSLSPSRHTRALRLFDFQATGRPPQAEPISAVGTYGSASVSPSQPDQPPHRSRPELAGKSCFPTEVRPKLPELPARNSPSFLHQIDRRFIDLLFMDNQASEVQPISRRNLQRVVEMRRIHYRATLSLRASKSGEKFWDRSKYKGDSAEFSAEV